MHIRKMLSILGLMFAAAIVLPALHADEINQATKVTFSQPVQVPGKTLPAGSYWIQLARTVSDPEIVQIFNEKYELVATLLTISRQRHEPTEHSAFVLANEGAGKGNAIVAWFYPGRTEGHEFLYSKSEQQELARDRKETLVAGD
jgi:hypothetical protein